MVSGFVNNYSKLSANFQQNRAADCQPCTTGFPPPISGTMIAWVRRSNAASMARILVGPSLGISMNNLTDIAEFMRSKSLLLVTAESCTAGLIAATLADIPGAGALLDCAFVVYSVDAKQRCLDVSDQTLERCNLTSEEVAREMVAGALTRSRANMAISNTGVADDSDENVPQGTQCFAWAFQRGQTSGDAMLFSETRRFEGDRNAIRQASARYALLRIPYYYGRLNGFS